MGAAQTQSNRLSRDDFKVMDGNKKYNLDGSVNRSHPNKVKGKSSEVYAFRTEEEIEAMVNVFNKHIQESSGVRRKIACRNKLMFIIGISVGLRASDLRVLKWSRFFDENGDKVEKSNVMPKKTQKEKKYVPIFLTDLMEKAINNYINEYPIEDYDTYLFVSRKNTGRDRVGDQDVPDINGNMPIAEKSILKILKDTAKEAGIKQNIGSHSLRKTFGYSIYHKAENKTDAVIRLQRLFNHSKPSITEKYIGITDDELEETVKSLDFGLNLFDF